MDVAVYLFTGFLEAGKTTLITETLQDEKFNAGEKTLIIACEEGVEEYDPTALPGDVSYESIDTLSQLNPDKLSALQRKHKAERIMIEYNGMWLNDDLYQAMPDNWYIYQEIMLADANTFVNYNANMRSLVVNKLQNCEMVVFNRFDENKVDRMELHKIVRGVSRRVNIAYETNEHEIEYDEIEDPLPFDLEADIVEIADRDYAIWYRDMSEEMEKYQGKVLRMTGMVARDPALPPKSFVIGRHVMTCCMDDIAYRGLVCTGEAKCELESKDWITLTARLDIEFHKLYKSKGPVLKVISIEKREPLPPDEQLATFY
jgi:hypothetical protein